MRKIFLQIGATRDGQNPYCEVAKRDGYFTVLAEMSDFVDYQSLSLTLPFDLIVRLDRPENPWEVLQACLHAGLLEHPRVVLAGFEAYNASAGRVREILAGPDAPRTFIPLDKYAQRMALKKAWPRFPQPEFRFFASPLSILDAHQALIYPCVIKPVDSGGGLGIWLVEAPERLAGVVQMLEETMNYGGRSFSGFIVESWLDGDEYSLQGVVHDGHPHALTCCQKVIEQHRDAQGGVSFYESGHVAVAAETLPPAFASLMKFCCETFGYRLGAFHIDFIVVDGVPHFLEMGFRLSGMGVPSLVEEATGIDWVAVAFRLEAGGEMPALRFVAPPFLDPAGEPVAPVPPPLGRLRMGFGDQGQLGRVGQHRGQFAARGVVILTSLIIGFEIAFVRRDKKTAQLAVFTQDRGFEGQRLGIDLLRMIVALGRVANFPDIGKKHDRHDRGRKADGQERDTQLLGDVHVREHYAFLSARRIREDGHRSMPVAAIKAMDC